MMISKIQEITMRAQAIEEKLKELENKEDKETKQLRVGRLRPQVEPKTREQGEGDHDDDAHGGDGRMSHGG
jgi:hypothetical protein